MADIISEILHQEKESKHLMEVKLIGYRTLSRNLFQNANQRGSFYPKVISTFRLKFGAHFLY